MTPEQEESLNMLENGRIERAVMIAKFEKQQEIDAIRWKFEPEAMMDEMEAEMKKENNARN